MDSPAPQHRGEYHPDEPPRAPRRGRSSIASPARHRSCRPQKSPRRTRAWDRHATRRHSHAPWRPSCKICLGVRKAHVTRATRDIVEHKGLVAVIQKRKRHGILLMRSDMRKRTSAADNHGRTAAIRFIGQRLGTQIRKRRRIFLGRLLAPQRMVLDNHMCSLRAIRAHSFSPSSVPQLDPRCRNAPAIRFPSTDISHNPSSGPSFSSVE